MNRHRAALPALLIMVLLLSAVLTGPVLGQVAPTVSVISPTSDQLVQGNTYNIKWGFYGVQSISIVTTGILTSIPQNPRGAFNIVLADHVPASQGSVVWTVPFLDTVRFQINAIGYDNAGQQVAASSKAYIFRPDSLRNRTASGIYVDSRDPNVQRLYVMRNNRVIKAYLTSGSRSREYYPRNIHPSTPHEHYGVFKVYGKYPIWHSMQYNVDMFWAMRYWSGHFIHGTYPDQYPKLGTPASSGCTRLTQEDAKELYDMTPIGTRVEIIIK